MLAGDDDGVGVSDFEDEFIVFRVVGVLWEGLTVGVFLLFGLIIELELVLGLLFKFVLVLAFDGGKILRF